MNIALRKGNADPLFCKRHGDHLPQVAGDLGGVGLKNIDPETNLESERTLRKISKKNLRLRFFFYEAMALNDVSKQLGHAAGIRTISYSQSYCEAHLAVRVCPVNDAALQKGAVWNQHFGAVPQ